MMFSALSSRLKRLRSEIKWLKRSFGLRGEIGWFLDSARPMASWTPGFPVLLRYRKELLLEINPGMIKRSADRRMAAKIKESFLFDTQTDWDSIADERTTEGGGSTSYNATLRKSLEDPEVVAGRKQFCELPEVVEFKTRIRKGDLIKVNGKIVDKEGILDALLAKYTGIARNILESGYDPGKVKEHIGVAVDRNGELIKFNNGRHRLIIAQALKLPTIPVEVKAVDVAWLEECMNRFGGTRRHAFRAGLTDIRRKYSK